MTLEGTPAPDFSLPGPAGVTALSDLKGNHVVAYFYPRADTSGCTREAVDFTGLLPEFTAAGVTVLAISKDPVAKLSKFADKHGLGVTLLSDEDSDVCERYGVWVEKSMYGRTFLGIERSTFLLDGDGVVRREWRKVKVPGHADAVLAAVRDL